MFSSMMFTGLMANTWIAASIVAVIAGLTGFFAVLRGETFAAHAIPNGAFAGAAGASLLGINVIWGLAVVAIASALGIGALGSKARHDVVTALTLVLMLGVGALFVSVSNQYAQQAYSLLFGEVFGVSSADVPLIAALGVLALAGIGLAFRPLMLTSAMPEVAAGPRHLGARHGDLLPRRDGPGHVDDGAGGRRAADVQPDDRPGRRRPQRHRPARPRARPVGGDRPGHRVDSIALSYRRTGRSASSSASAARCSTSPGWPPAASAALAAVPAGRPRRLARTRSEAVHSHVSSATREVQGKWLGAGLSTRAARGPRRRRRAGGRRWRAAA